MKKIISFISVIAMIISVSSMSAIAEENTKTFETYDFNSDGKVNGEDIYLITQRYLEIATQRTDIIADQSVRDKVDSYADIDKDGYIDMNDVLALGEILAESHSAGDVNFDGEVNAVDASMVLTYYALISVDEEHMVTADDYGIIFLGDYDKDGYINASDASDILCYYASTSVNNENWTFGTQS